MEDNAIKAIRIKYGYTQESLGKAFGISRRTIQNWEEGKSRIPEYLPMLLEFYLAHKGKK